MDNERKQALADFIANLNLTYAVEFVPQSQSRNRGKAPSLNWRISISKPGVVSSLGGLTTDYTQGIGHVPVYVSPARGDFVDVRKMKDAKIAAAESGRYPVSCLPNKSIFHQKALPVPEFLDVLYNLVLDSDVLNYPGFESWASEFGYDTDSRKAEGIYRECLDIALKLRSILGDANLERLRELFQDY